MHKQFAIYIFIFFISACTLSAIFPYPIFSNYTNVTRQEATKIINYNETEIDNNFSIKPRILDLEFSDINHILPENFEIIDIYTQEIIYATRIGGNNHADIIFDKANTQTLHRICTNWSWDKRPVLVKINETAFLPASLTTYPHGFNNHFCLHFKNSKTHGTNKIDTQSQRSIDTAKQKGKSIIAEHI